LPSLQLEVLMIGLFDDTLTIFALRSVCWFVREVCWTRRDGGGSWILCERR
jgi:hypothetical protein